MSEVTPEDAIRATRIQSREMLASTAARVEMPASGPVDAAVAWSVFVDFVGQPLLHRGQAPLEDRAEIETVARDGTFLLRLSRTTVLSDVETYPDDPEGTVLISMHLDWGTTVDDELAGSVPTFQLAPAGGTAPPWAVDPLRPHEHQTLDELVSVVGEGPLASILALPNSSIELFDEEA